MVREYMNMEEVVAMAQCYQPRGCQNAVISEANISCARRRSVGFDGVPLSRLGREFGGGD